MTIHQPVSKTPAQKAKAAVDAARKKALRKKAKEEKAATSASPSMTLADPPAPKTPPEVLEAQRARRARAKARKAEEERQQAEARHRIEQNIAEAEDLIKEASYRGRFYQEQIDSFAQLAERFTQEGTYMVHHLSGLDAAVAALQGSEVPPEALERIQAAINKVKREGEALTVRRDVMLTLKQKFAQQAEGVAAMSAKAEQMLQQLRERELTGARAGGHAAGAHPGPGVANSRKKNNL
jgi:DNA repair exonuclease SbcCD ATPase subunit